MQAILTFPLNGCVHNNRKKQLRRGSLRARNLHSKPALDMDPTVSRFLSLPHRDTVSHSPFYFLSFLTPECATITAGARRSFSLSKLSSASSAQWARFTNHKRSGSVSHINASSRLILLIAYITNCGLQLVTHMSRK